MISPPILNVRRADFLLRQPRPRMLIDQILARESVAVIAAEPYTGKTFLALEMMRAVAVNGKFLHTFQAAGPGNSLYLGNDSPPWDLAAQFDKVIGLPDPRLENVPEVLAKTALGSYGFVFDTQFTLNTSTDAERVVQAARRFASERQPGWDGNDPQDYYTTSVPGTDLIVIDTLRSVHGFEENDNTAMQHVMNLLRYIASRTKSAVVALHHYNKSTKESVEASLERLRGATCIGGAVDTVYALTRKGEGGPIKFHVLKNRPAPDTKSFTYEMEAGDHHLELRIRPSQDLAEKKAAVLNFLMSRPPGWVRTETVPGGNRVLTSLEKDGKVVRIHGAVRLVEGGTQ